MKIKLTAIVLIVFLLIGGCAQNPPTVSDTESRVITDVYGRQVKVPEKVETIAAIGGAARILTYAGCADKLVGVTDMDKKSISEMPYSVVNAEHFAKIASVGSGGADDIPYIEELVALSPDVIFGLTDENIIKNVAEKTGIPTVGIYPDGMFDESFYFALELIGLIMGTQEQSLQVSDYIKDCQRDLNDRTKDIRDESKPSVYTGAVNFRGSHGIEGTYADYPPFTAIGAKNVADETARAGAFIIDLEKITVWNPDIIFLNPANMDIVNESYSKNKAFYQGLKAVQNKKIYTQISYNYNWTNMEIAVADAYYAGKVIYPERFSDIDPIKKADEIFTVMLGRPFYENLAADGSRFEKIALGE
ncbi:MAG: ABC transporter substrate-binding protein [Clostridiales bacterium]|jgi:iron complex transport system substrate-binding protein|nr:ABC transporter substrate-binding protein [Clostridiales bacterium]